MYVESSNQNSVHNFANILSTLFHGQESTNLKRLGIILKVMLKYLKVNHKLVYIAISYVLLAFSLGQATRDFFLWSG